MKSKVDLAVHSEDNEVLKRLSEDESRFIRKLVASNSHIPLSALKKN